MQTQPRPGSELQRYSAWVITSRDLSGKPLERFGSRLKKSISSGGEIPEQLDAVFDRRGPLAARIPEFRVRPQQLEMANRVAGAIRDNAVLVCEAGTGTGKTFAYLVPALLSAGKVILSTGTKTLQDQLYHRDLPTVRAALNVPVTTALLKGRANYVCHYHLERNLEGGGVSGRELVGDLQRIVSFARVTRTGDKSAARRGLAAHRELRARYPHRRQERACRRAGGSSCLEPCHLDPGKLSGAVMPAISRLFRDACTARGARRGPRRRQPSSILRRCDAQGRGDGGAFACVQYRDLRRGAPAPGNGYALFRRNSVHGTTDRARTGCARGSAFSCEGHARPASAHGRAGQGGPGSAPRAAQRSRALHRGIGYAEARIFECARRARFRAALGVRSPRRTLRAQRGSCALLRARASGVRLARTLARRQPRRSRALDRGAQSLTSAECHAAFHRGDFPQAARRPSARLDFCLRDARGRRRLRPLPQRDGPGQRTHRVLGQPFRLRCPGSALRSEEAPGSE